MPNILIIDDKVPDPVFGAGFPRAYRLLLSLIELGHKVYFFPTSRQTVANLDKDALRSFNIHVIDDVKEIESLDAAIISRPHNVHYHMPYVKNHHPKAKIIYDTEALWYRRYDLQLSITGRLPWWAYRYDEIGMAQQSDLCFVVNSEEKGILESHGCKRVRILAHALHTHTNGLDFDTRKDFLVVGGILEPDSSNEDALWWYLENSWTPVHEATGATINITGHRHTERLLSNPFPQVNLAGLVENLVPMYESHRVFVAATRFATGIPWKVHESMAHGCPCVISELLAKQLGAVPGKDAMVAANNEEFINKSIELYKNKDLWQEVRENGFRLIKRDCDPENFKSVLQASLAELL